MPKPDASTRISSSRITWVYVPLALVALPDLFEVCSSNNTVLCVTLEQVAS